MRHARHALAARGNWMLIAVVEADLQLTNSFQPTDWIPRFQLWAGGDADFGERE